MRTAPRTAAPRRFLVLTDESARHPFRASLPPHFREPLTDDAPEETRSWRLSRRDWRDWRDIFGTWCATFAAVTTFIF